MDPRVTPEAVLRIKRSLLAPRKKSLMPKAQRHPHIGKRDTPEAKTPLKQLLKGCCRRKRCVAERERERRGLDNDCLEIRPLHARKEGRRGSFSGRRQRGTKQTKRVN